MPKTLDYFRFFPLKHLTDVRVLRMSHAEYHAFMMCLARQWVDGALPYEVDDLIPILPSNVDKRAVTRVVLQFFPPDPDTNLRRNPDLEEDRIDTLRAVEKRRGAQVQSVEARRENKKRQQLTSSPRTPDPPLDRGEYEVETWLSTRGVGPVSSHVVDQCRQIWMDGGTAGLERLWQSVGGDTGAFKQQVRDATVRV
jgi:hypothetical protein